MAIPHSPKAGQWSKSKAEVHHRRGFLIIFISGYIVIFLLGLAVGSSFHSVYAGVTFLILLIPFVFALRWFERNLDVRLDREAKARLHALLGGQAEALVSYYFRQKLSDRWHLFDNLRLDATSDIDHVLVGPSGIFIVSTKSQKGLFAANASGGLPTFNGNPSDWARDATNQAMRLRERLTMLRPDTAPYIQSVLAMPLAAIHPSISTLSSDPRPPFSVVQSARIANEENLIAVLETPAGDRGTFGKTEREMWVTTVSELYERSTPST